MDKNNTAFFVMLALVAILPISQTSFANWNSQNYQNSPKIAVEKQNKVELSSEKIVLPIKPVIKENKLDTILDELSFCESGRDNTKIGKAGEIGIFQYKISTWNWFNKIRGTDLDILSVSDQTDMTYWAWENGYKNHWTCAKIVLGEK